MAQAILDMFPDAISDYGLIGCALSVVVPTYLCVCAVGVVCFLLRRIGWVA